MEDLRRWLLAQQKHLNNLAETINELRREQDVAKERHMTNRERIVRIERFILGILITVAGSALVAVLSLIGWNS